MLAVIGVLLTSVTVLLYTLAVVEFRKPSPARWTRSAVSEQAVVLAFAGAIAASIGLMIKGAAHFTQESAGLIGFEGALMLGIIVGTVAIIRLINPGKRLRAHGTQNKTG